MFPGRAIVRIPKAEERAFSLSQLLDVKRIILERSFGWRDLLEGAPDAPNLRYVTTLRSTEANLDDLNDKLIEPDTEHHRRSYVELVADEPRSSKWFLFILLGIALILHGLVHIHHGSKEYASVQEFATTMAHRLRPSPGAFKRFRILPATSKWFQSLSVASSIEGYEFGTLTEAEYGNSFVPQMLGVRMPRMIYGTVALSNDTAHKVVSAVQAGYRAIDTSNDPEYYDERAVGVALQAIFKYGYPRDKFFIQTKVKLDMFDMSSQSVGSMVAQSIETSLNNLGLSYVDSLLLDQPSPEQHGQTMEAWAAMEEAARSGRVRQLGVSNVRSLEQLYNIYRDAQLKPAVVQQQFMGADDIREWCAELGIFFQSYIDIKRPVNNKRIQVLANSCGGASPPALFFRFIMGLGVMPIVCSQDEESMKEDISAFGVIFDAEDVTEIQKWLMEDADSVVKMKKM